MTFENAVLHEFLASPAFTSTWAPDVTGFIVRLVVLHHKPFSTAGIFTGRITGRLFYCIESNRGF
jgi:hypothetical protein